MTLVSSSPLLDMLLVYIILTQCSCKRNEDVRLAALIGKAVSLTLGLQPLEWIVFKH